MEGSATQTLLLNPVQGRIREQKGIILRKEQQIADKGTLFAFLSLTRIDWYTVEQGYSTPTLRGKPWSLLVFCST